jgi:hypothetical protein
VDETWIPIVMFVGLTIILCTVAWLRFKTKEGLQQIFRSALDKGQELTPEVIDRLGHPKPAKDKDLRSGIIWVAVALGLTAFGFGIPDDDDVARIFMGIAAFPLMIGIAYLILHKVTDRD